jgi:hypothetical protein
MEVASKAKVKKNYKSKVQNPPIENWFEKYYKSKVQSP